MPRRNHPRHRSTTRHHSARKWTRGRFDQLERVICPTGKPGFTSHETALARLAAIIAKHQERGQMNRRVPRRVYRCWHCNGWHLTSSPRLPQERTSDNG